MAKIQFVSENIQHSIGQDSCLRQAGNTQVNAAFNNLHLKSPKGDLGFFSNHPLAPSRGDIS